LEVPGLLDLLLIFLIFMESNCSLELYSKWPLDRYLYSKILSTDSILRRNLL
jgi:hypothetical protein